MVHKIKIQTTSTRCQYAATNKAKLSSSRSVGLTQSLRKRMSDKTRWDRCVNKQKSTMLNSSVPEIVNVEKSSSVWFRRKTQPRMKTRTKLKFDFVIWAIVTKNELAVKTPIFARSTSKFPVVNSKSKSVED